MNDKQRNISLLIIDFLMVISLLIFILSNIELFSRLSFIIKTSIGREIKWK